MLEISNGVKRIGLLAAGVVLIAAACNPAPATTPPPPAQNSTQSTSQGSVSGQVELIVSELETSLASEEAINFATDDDIISDQEVISEYEEVSNVSF